MVVLLEASSSSVTFESDVLSSWTGSAMLGVIFSGVVVALGDDDDDDGVGLGGVSGIVASSIDFTESITGGGVTGCCVALDPPSALPPPPA